MNLRSRTHLVAMMTLLIVAVLCSVFLFVRLQKTQVEREIVRVDTLMADAIQFRGPLFDYLLHREIRPHLQAEAKLSDLHRLLGDQTQLTVTHLPHDAQSKVLWDEVSRLLAECETLFAELSSREATPAPREQEQRTADLLLLSSESLILTISQIHRLVVSELLEDHAYEEMTLWTLLAGLGGLGISLFLLLRKGVLVPLQQLHEAAILVAAGQWDFRLRSRRRGEFGQLANAFDHMLDQLQEATVSRDRLETEISERQRAEADLRGSEERLRLFLEYAPVALAMFDREMRYIAVSRRWMDVAHFTDDNHSFFDDQEIIGRSHYDLLPELPDHWKAVHRRALEGEVIQIDEDNLTRIDGTVQWLRRVVLPWHRDDGVIGGIVIFVDDITARQRAEAEVHRLNVELEDRVRQRTAELEAANQELDSFAYAVSHDLRAPLRAMSGFSQALQEDYGEQLDGEARVYLDQIIIASRHMSGLIDGLLTLSRSTRGELRRDPVDLTALAKRLLMDQAAAEPERQVVWQVEPGLCIQGDPLMLEVVMRNLVENAWKYTAKTPNATIRVYTENQEGKRYFCVADNGAGFDMNHANRLFKAFQRLHRQDEFPGIGIGLATVQRIIHRHGGAIRAEGAPGCGATFRFTLPTAETTSKEIQ